MRVTLSYGIEIEDLSSSMADLITKEKEKLENILPLLTYCANQLNKDCDPTIVAETVAEFKKKAISSISSLDEYSYILSQFQKMKAQLNLDAREVDVTKPDNSSQATEEDLNEGEKDSD